jgi:hypothetical protein
MDHPVFDPELNAWTNINIAGSHKGRGLAALDYRLRQVIRDKAMLEYWAEGEFVRWLSEARNSAETARTKLDACDTYAMLETFVFHFCDSYERELTHPRFVLLENPTLEWDEQDPATFKTRLITMDMETPWYVRTDASYFDPQRVDGIKNIQRDGRNVGVTIAKAHQSFTGNTIIEDKEALRNLAEKQCSRWWKRLENHEALEGDLPEIKRLFIGGFMEGYRYYLDASRENDARDKATAQKEWRKTSSAQGDILEDTGVTLTITDQSEQADGILYRVDFADPDRMTQPVSFGIHVTNDGVVEVQEV